MKIATFCTKNLKMYFFLEFQKKFHFFLKLITRQFAGIVNASVCMYPVKDLRSGS